MDTSEVVDLVINAGGTSRRMGRAKALLPVPPRETPLIVHVMQRLLPLVTGKAVVVTNDRQIEAVVHAAGATQVVPDQWEEGGALGGVATGLAHCRGWAMVVACDMPLVSPAIFIKLLALAEQEAHAHAIIPRLGGRVQPFHGLWHTRARPALAAHVVAGELAFHRALANMSVRWADEKALGIKIDDPAFYNVNTPAEWAEALVLLGEQNGPDIQ